MLHHLTLYFQEDSVLFPKDAQDKTLYSDIDYLETYKALEHCATLGLTKSIGVSNFNSQQLRRIIENAKIKPVCNQVHGYKFYKTPYRCSKKKRITYSSKLFSLV